MAADVPISTCSAWRKVTASPAGAVDEVLDMVGLTDVAASAPVVLARP